LQCTCCLLSSYALELWIRPRQYIWCLSFESRVGGHEIDERHLDIEIELIFMLTIEQLTKIKGQNCRLPLIFCNSIPSVAAKNSQIADRYDRLCYWNASEDRQRVSPWENS